MVVVVAAAVEEGDRPDLLEEEGVAAEEARHPRRSSVGQLVAVARKHQWKVFDSKPLNVGPMTVVVAAAYADDDYCYPAGSEGVDVAVAVVVGGGDWEQLVVGRPLVARWAEVVADEKKASPPLRSPC